MNPMLALARRCERSTGLDEGRLVREVAHCLPLSAACRCQISRLCEAGGHLDAAKSLIGDAVREVEVRECRLPHRPSATVRLWCKGPAIFIGKAATPVLALCAATLREHAATH